MKMATKDIIKVLPFDPEFKSKLLSDFDTLDPDQKFTIEQIVWDAYYALYQLKLEENLQLALARAGKNKESLDDTLYKRVREQTEQEMQEEYVKGTTQADLSATRDTIQSMIKSKKGIS